MNYYFLDEDDGKYSKGEGWAVLSERRYFRDNKPQHLVVHVCYSEAERDYFRSLDCRVIKGQVKRYVILTEEGEKSHTELAFYVKTPTLKVIK